jgi:hypothetical protein
MVSLTPVSRKVRSVLLKEVQIIYNILFSPLKHIPGPFLARFTSKWLTINEVLGNRSLIVEQAHHKYGPVIRIAPDELSFSEQSCIKELYYQGTKFPKSRRYEGFASTTRASFDMTDIVKHRERRHLVRHVLSKVQHRRSRATYRQASQEGTHLGRQSGWKREFFRSYALGTEDDA